MLKIRGKTLWICKKSAKQDKNAFENVLNPCIFYLILLKQDYMFSSVPSKADFWPRHTKAESKLWGTVSAFFKSDDVEALQARPTICNPSPTPSPACISCIGIRKCSGLCWNEKFKKKKKRRGGERMLQCCRRPVAYIIVQAAGFSTPVGMRNRPCHEMHWSRSETRTLWHKPEPYQWGSHGAQGNLLS